MENDSSIKQYYYIPDLKNIQTIKSININPICNKCSFENVIQYGYDYLFNCCQKILNQEDITAYKIYKRKQHKKYDQVNNKRTNTSLNYYRNKI